jgi:hypothetical protein
MGIKKPLHAPPFLSLHALAASRGDGLRPELVDLFGLLANGADSHLSESVPAPEGCSFDAGPDHQGATEDQRKPKNTDDHKG